jgi:hypothetical protein
LLLERAPERETDQLRKVREDIEIETTDHERNPRIVASGETPLIELRGAKAKLYGDQDGSSGWAVDNFILLEIVDGANRVLDRAVAGFSDNVSIGPENVDNVGPRTFKFEPGEVDLTSKLPEEGKFRIRATALDYFGVGRVSDVFLVLEYPQREDRDDLKYQ